VSTQDVAIPNDGRQYRIVQVQYPEDVQPPVMDLTLEEVAATIGSIINTSERFDEFLNALASVKTATQEMTHTPSHWAALWY